MKLDRKRMTLDALATTLASMLSERVLREEPLRIDVKVSPRNGNLVVQAYGLKEDPGLKELRVPAVGVDVGVDVGALHAKDQVGLVYEQPLGFCEISQLAFRTAHEPWAFAENVLTELKLRTKEKTVINIPVTRIDFSLQEKRADDDARTDADLGVLLDDRLPVKGMFRDGAQRGAAPLQHELGFATRAHP